MMQPLSLRVHVNLQLDHCRGQLLQHAMVPDIFEALTKGATNLRTLETDVFYYCL